MTVKELIWDWYCGGVGAESRVEGAEGMEALSERRFETKAFLTKISGASKGLVKIFTFMLMKLVNMVRQLALD